jgi:predicted O-methyltransferase YrrM
MRTMKVSVQTDARMWEAYNEFHFRCDTHRFAKIFARAELVRMIADVPGNIVDAGAYKGISTLQFAHAINAYCPNSSARVVAFDTFTSTFPRVRADESKSATDHMNTYDPTALDRLREAIREHALGERIELVIGDIVETMPAFVEKHPGFRVNLLHCDLDVYKPTLAVLESLWSRVVPGGIAVFDEYAVDNWGESDAVDEFFAKIGYRARLRRVPQSPTPAAYCVKESF